MTVIFKFVTSITVSCLHFGQNRGKFFSSVSSLILVLVLVLLLQIGQYIHIAIIIMKGSLSSSKTLNP